MHWRFLSGQNWLFLSDPEWLFQPGANTGLDLELTSSGKISVTRMLSGLLFLNQARLPL